MVTSTANLGFYVGEFLYVYPGPLIHISLMVQVVMQWNMMHPWSNLLHVKWPVCEFYWTSVKKSHPVRSTESWYVKMLHIKNLNRRKLTIWRLFGSPKFLTPWKRTVKWRHGPIYKHQHTQTFNFWFCSPYNIFKHYLACKSTMFKFLVKGVNFFELKLYWHRHKSSNFH